MDKQNEIPLILKQDSKKSDEKLRIKYMKIKKLYKYTYLCSANIMALLIYLFSLITSNIIPGAYMGKWQYTRSENFMLVSLISVFVLVFLSLIIAIVYYFKAQNNSISWYHVSSLIRSFYKKKINDSENLDSNLENVKSGLYSGLFTHAVGNLIDNDLLSNIGSLEQGIAIGGFANAFNRQAKLIEKTFNIKGFDKFIVRTPIIISVIYMIVMAIVGINLTNADKQEILNGRYEAISFMLSIYSDMGAKIDNNYSFDSSNKTYDSQYASIVMNNGDEISFSMINSPKITDNIDYIISYKNVNENDLSNIVNDFASRTMALQNRAKSFKKYVDDTRQVDALVMFNDENKQDILNKIVSLVQEKSDFDFYNIKQMVPEIVYYQTTYINIDYNSDGTYSIQFSTKI